MFKTFLKFIIAGSIGGIWYYIDDNGVAAVSIALFLFVFFILILKPIGFKSSKKSEDYIQKMREKKERLIIVENKQREEIERAKKFKRLKREQDHSTYREFFDSKIKE